MDVEPLFREVDKSPFDVIKCITYASMHNLFYHRLID